MKNKTTASSPPGQRHNVIAAGAMPDVLADAFPGFGAGAPNLSIASAWLPALRGHGLGTWPAALFKDEVSFNWLFLNAADLATPGIDQLLTLSQQIAPTLLYCFRVDADLDTDDIAAQVGAKAVQDGRGIVVSSYTGSGFQAPVILRAFARRAAGDRPAPVLPGDDVCDGTGHYGRARELIISSGTVSLSLVQRTLELSYTRAAQLIDAMVGDILERNQDNGRLSLRPDAHDMRPHDRLAPAPLRAR